MGRNITLVGKRLCWSDALLYCRDFHWDLLSIRGPEEQEMIDEMVSSAPFSLTSHLWVGLRRSILGTSWFWMSGDPMDFTQWEHGSHQSSPCGSMASMEPSTWRQRSCEEHLNFFCYTEMVAPPPSISIQEMGRNITLVGKRLCWSDALLYCRDFHWDLLSIRGPEEQEIIDEMVSRANFPLTSHLWVGLRRLVSSL
ncbi:hypothetical protein NHX12_012215 [Muraenolepis orangiensis]|uniref:C-type lectin domain-containing protein n=1 Tax=Muraenolepis orangiensis TaxID=630683 RepID=A0A9Q0I6W8_9TELE|nr:hypothetical protein NHX12_012215 [Muraenolepis orangiensis]